ncbi:MAG TPA: PDDEXK nuclease domain-containing protein [Flavobacteriales bacterium]|nr:PDDEXK nuclease domain-containing protein [Flavobacteriales bacterium]
MPKKKPILRKSTTVSPTKRPAPLYKRVQAILEQAQETAARSVNTAQVVANWLIGREIVDEEQRGKRKADYGDRLLDELSAKLTKSHGNGYSATNLRLFRQFYANYPLLLGGGIHHAVSDELEDDHHDTIHHAPRDEFGKPLPMKAGAIPHAVRGKSEAARPTSGNPRQSWKPGQLNTGLSWTHYRTLLRVEKPLARSFYEIEAVGSAWSARELERQINSLLFDRLAKSKDKKGVMRLAKKGHEILRPADVFKDPVVFEFLGIPKTKRLQETDLESMLITNLQDFLLELGKGFALVSRQERITLDGDHFYVDLVFYHTVLKCYILIDLKVGKLTHEDLGQIQLYVNYYDEERCTKGDNPTLGLILCTDKNDAVVRYTLGKGNQKIFATRYKLHVPTEAELRKELQRELKLLIK